MAYLKSSTRRSQNCALTTYLNWISTAKRVLSDPAFKLIMQYAGLLGKDSKIASAIYRPLPAQEHGFYRKLTGMAMQLLKQGKTEEESFKQLYNDFIPLASPVKNLRQKPVSNT